tara:strand:+ start:483 stop:674 length:192 start_codon:yes stop_codon:yes gene_type:complete
MPSTKPPLLSLIEELKKEIKQLRGDITEMKELLESEVVVPKEVEIPFRQRNREKEQLPAGWFW